MTVEELRAALKDVDGGMPVVSLKAWQILQVERVGVEDVPSPPVSGESASQKSKVDPAFCIRVSG